MKMGNAIFKTIMVGFISICVFVTACKKDSTPGSTPAATAENNAATTLSGHGATSDNVYDDVFNVAVQTGQDNSLNNIGIQLGGVQTNSVTGNHPTGYFCAAVSVSPQGDTFPKTVVVDFGSGCTSADGVVRSGVITYTFTELFRNNGAKITAVFDNYVVNGYELGGIYSITNNSSIAAGIVYTTQVVNGSLIYPNDSTYTFSGTKTVTQTAGVGSSDITTWVFSVTGGYTITNSLAESLTATVTTPLVKKETCPNIVSGVIAFTYTAGTLTVPGTLDYGTGDCDATATVKIGTTFTKTITL